MLKPLRRNSTNKHRSAKRFRNQAGRTKGINIAAPMRGGIRL